MEPGNHKMFIFSVAVILSQVLSHILFYLDYSSSYKYIFIFDYYSYSFDVYSENYANIHIII